MTKAAQPVARTRVQPVSGHDAEVVCGTPFVVEDDRGFLHPAATEQELSLFRGPDDCYTLK